MGNGVTLTADRRPVDILLSKMGDVPRGLHDLIQLVVASETFRSNGKARK